MPSSGTSKVSQVFVRPARISSSAFSTKCSAHGRGVGLEVGARPVALERVAPLRDLPLEVVSGPFSAVFGRLICTLLPVAFT